MVEAGMAEAVPVARAVPLNSAGIFGQSVSSAAGVTACGVVVQEKHRAAVDGTAGVNPFHRLSTTKQHAKSHSDLAPIDSDQCITRTKWL